MRLRTYRAKMTPEQQAHCDFHKSKMNPHEPPLSSVALAEQREREERHKLNWLFKKRDGKAMGARLPPDHVRAARELLRLVFSLKGSTFRRLKRGLWIHALRIN
jgi:DNA invertase Pin-like site-specific DNA recombinase